MPLDFFVCLQTRNSNSPHQTVRALLFLCAFLLSNKSSVQTFGHVCAVPTSPTKRLTKHKTVLAEQLGACYKGGKTENENDSYREK